MNKKKAKKDSIGLAVFIFFVIFAFYGLAFANEWGNYYRKVAQSDRANGLISNSSVYNLFSTNIAGTAVPMFDARNRPVAISIVTTNRDATYSLDLDYWVCVDANNIYDDCDLRKVISLDSEAAFDADGILTNPLKTYGKGKIIVNSMYVHDGNGMSTSATAMITTNQPVFIFVRPES